MRVFEECEHEIFAIPTPLGSIDVYSFLIVQNQSAVIIDTGLKQTFKKIKEAIDLLRLSPRSIKAIINTHSHHDHIGCNEELKTYANCPLIAHRFAVPWIENHQQQFQEFLCHFADQILPDQEIREFFFQNLGRQAKVDHMINDFYQLNLDGRLLNINHAPGHSQDGIIVHDLKSNTLITGDALMGNGVGNTIPQYDDLKAYQETISMVEKLHPSRILTAHFAPFRGDKCADFLLSCQNSVKKIDQAIREIYHENFHFNSLLELTEKLCKRLKKDLMIQSLYTVKAHLNTMADEKINDIKIESEKVTGLELTKSNKKTGRQGR